ncbi:MAG TPA: class I SAM-dependent methyltransferase [Bryobacteraceae bacterium]|nr:class I SAM-dependent methyltransferase [Bryobacteraceae bacterium]
MRSLITCILFIFIPSSAIAQITDAAIAEAFWEWEKSAPPSSSEAEALSRYRLKLKKDGLTDAAIEDTLVRLKREALRQEGEFYDSIYAKGTKSALGPNKLLVEAVRGRKPGSALDVAMGQGRNSVYLANLGWTVTGFDISKVGLQQANTKAKAEGVVIRTVLTGDEDFDFGYEKWDLIAIIYALEKRSVRRARQALKPGGIVVVESGHKDASGAPFEYETGELQKIFEGFQILRAEKITEKGDWGEKPYPLVRIIAQKPSRTR